MRPAVTTDEDLRYDISDRIAEISLAGPSVNALSIALLEQLIAALRRSIEIVADRLPAPAKVLVGQLACLQLFKSINHLVNLDDVIMVTYHGHSLVARHPIALAAHPQEPAAGFSEDVPGRRA
jgi:hypothetical protein